MEQWKSNSSGFVVSLHREALGMRGGWMRMPGHVVSHSTSVSLLVRVTAAHGTQTERTDPGGRGMCQASAIGF